MFQIFVSSFLLLLVEFLPRVILDHDLVHLLLLHVAGDCLVISLLPHSDALVETPREDDITGLTHDEVLDFHGVFFQVHDELVGVHVPEFDVAVLAARKQVMGFWDEPHHGHGLLVREYGFNGVSEVHIPQPNVLVHATRC